MWTKVKTALVVILLSCLIWVAAERAVTKEATTEITLELPTGPKELMVQYLDDQDNPLPQLRQNFKITVEGPAGKIQAVREEFLSTITLDVQELGYVPPEGKKSYDYRILVTTLLKGRLYSKDQQSDNYLLVTESEPQTAHFRVTKLTMHSLAIKVFNQDGLEMVPEKIEPKTLDAYVPEEGIPLEARLDLTENQRLQAVQAEITVNAKVNLPHRIMEYPVKIKLSKETNLLPEYEIRPPRLYISKPLSLEGKYKVIIDAKELEEYKVIKFRAALADQDKYINAPKHLVLNIFEEDLNKPDLKSARPPEYYLPEEEYGRIEILNKTQYPIKFHLEKITQE